MKTLRKILILACAASLASGLAVAGEIYKWTDAEGNVHYEDRPTDPTGTIERVNIVSRDTDNAAVQAQINARREARAVSDQVDSEATSEMTAEDIRREKEERAQKCAQYRERLESFLRSARLYREGEAGDREYLSDDEVLAARTRVEGQIKEYCGS